MRSYSEATRPLTIQKDGTWYCYGWDLPKNICEIFGQAGYIRTTYAYTPHGSVTEEEGDVTQPLQWSSEYADPELDLVYYNYRSYNPTDGRWIRRDSLGEMTGLNLYEFVHNNPCIHIDYTGLFIDTIWDVGNMIWDAGKITAGAITGNSALMAEGAIDLAFDTAAALVPGLPAGASKAARVEQKAAEKDLKKKVKRIAECEAIYSVYKSLKCVKCKKYSTCAEIGEQIVCWTAFSAGRKLYLDKKCDYYLEGSMREGSRKKEGTHKLEYAKAAKNLARCTSFLKDCR